MTISPHLVAYCVLIHLLNLGFVPLQGFERDGKSCHWVILLKGQ